MRSITFAAAALLGAAALPAAAAPATAQTAPAQTAPSIRPPARIDVGGQGSVDRAPDRVVVTFALTTNDDVAARATSANNSAYNALVGKLRALGLEGPAVKTTGYSLNFNPRPAQPNPQFTQRYGFVVTRNVTVTSDRTDQAGAIVDAGVAAGVSNVEGVSFGLRDARAAYRAALALAVADARAQADALAAAAQVRIVRILAVSTGTSAPRPIPLARMAPMSVAAAVPTDVQPSDLTVSATVSVTYEIAP